MFHKGGSQSVDEFWQRIDPLIKDAPRSLLEEVADLGGKMPLAKMAAIMRPRMGNAWPPERDSAVGFRLYVYALETLGLYDPDFRPQNGPYMD